MASNNTLTNNDENLFSAHFLSFSGDDVEEFLKAKENKNTRSKTDSNVALVMAFLVFGK